MPWERDEGYEGTDPAQESAAAGQRVRERRSSRRYPIELEFDLFHLWGASHLVWAGSGRTRDWSRSSVLIHWDKSLPAGSSVELVVRWWTGVQLIVVGRVMANEERGAVVKIIRRRFRGKPELIATPTDGEPAAPPTAKSGRVRAS